MNVGSIYRASHILPMPPLPDSTVGEAMGRGTRRNRDGAAVVGAQSSPAGGIDAEALQLGRLLKLSA